MKITLHDLIGTKNEDEENNIALELKEEIKTIEKNKNTDLNTHGSFKTKRKADEVKDFFNITPINDFERKLLNTNKKIENIIKMRKIDYQEKARENRILAEYDAKMHRIKKIKSKSYRKMRRKEKIKELQEKVVESDSSSHDESNVKDKVVIENKNIPNNLLEKYEEGFSKKVKEEASKNSFSVNESNDIVQILLNRAEAKKNEQNSFNNVFKFDGKIAKDIDQRELVSKLFSKNNDSKINDQEAEFDDKFIKEKDEQISEGLPVEEVTVLPGWGTWGGSNIEIVETKYNKIVKNISGVKNEERADKEISHVIINTNIKHNKELDKYKVKNPKAVLDKKMNNNSTNKKFNNKKTTQIFNRMVKEEKEDNEVFVYESKYK